MNLLLFGAFPYMALALFIAGTIYRYKTGFKYSSLSSQLLETDRLFSASLAFHIGIITIFLGHLVGFLAPSLFIPIGGLSLVIVETIGVMFGTLALIGMVMLFYRRVSNERVKMVTNKMDIVIEILLMIQFIIGILIAIDMHWGSQWYLSNMVPYLHSIFSFQPDISGISVMKPLAQVHVVVAFLIIGLIPFTRLVHFLVAPFHYILRPFQVVRWYWNPQTIRDANRQWKDVKRPKNN